MSTVNFDNELSRRPDNSILTEAWERGTNLWSEELFRRMNHDEAKVDRVPLPPLPDTLEEWEKAKPGILQAFKDCLYGDMPPAPDKLELRLLAAKPDALNGLANRYEYRILCRMDNGREFDFDMLLYVPKSRPDAPVFITLNFNGNQAPGPETDIKITRQPGQKPGRWHATDLNEPKYNFNGERLNFENAIKRGYAVATAAYGEIFPDNLDGFRKSIFTLFYDEADLRPDCEVMLQELQAGRRRNIGGITAWAWGMSRMADALEQLNFHRFAVVGHSRLGKAALWCGANDERFELVIPNNSGHGGAAPSRHKLGETLEMLWHIRSNWFCENMIHYVNLEDTLPIDQHQLIALCAPRSVYVGSSSLDVVADPKGEFISLATASKIWELYGVPGLGTDEMPPENTPIGGMAAYHVKTGKHSITAYDWEQYYNQADKIW